MKKTLLSLIAAGALTVGMSNVSATELNFDDIDTNTYIIGTRVYELNKYYLTIYDVVSAATEYAVNNDGETAPIYYLGGGEGEEYLEEITGPADASGEIQTAPKASMPPIIAGIIPAIPASPIVPAAATAIHITPKASITNASMGPILTTVSACSGVM